MAKNKDLPYEILIDAVYSYGLTKLTSRETDVLVEIVKGFKNKEIAYMLGISPETVKEYVSKVLRKFEVPTRTMLAHKAIKESIEYHDEFEKMAKRLLRKQRLENNY